MVQHHECNGLDSNGTLSTTSAHAGDRDSMNDKIPADDARPGVVVCFSFSHQVFKA